MPFLKFRCKTCGKLFDELVSASNIDKVKCPECKQEVERAYEGKCLFGANLSDSGGSGACGGCSGGNCSSCGH